MSKILLTLILVGLFGSASFAQNYSKYLRQGKVFYNKGEYLSALEHFDLAYEFAKKNTEKVEAKSWKNKSRVKIRERLKKADDDRNRIEQEESDKKVKEDLIERGNKCYKIKDYDCAAQNYSKALELDKTNVGLMTKLNSCYSRLKDYKRAYIVAKKLIVLDSLNYIHHYNFSHFALYNKDYEGSIKAGRKSLLLEEKKNWVISYIAIAYILNNQYSKAERIYKKYRNSHIGGYLNLARDGFYNDILRIERAGIKHSDFEKAKDLLNPHREKKKQLKE